MGIRAPCQLARTARDLDPSRECGIRPFRRDVLLFSLRPDRGTDLPQVQLFQYPGGRQLSTVSRVWLDSVLNSRGPSAVAS